MIKAVLFDLDETLFDRTGTVRLFLTDQHKRHEALSHVPVEEFVDMFLKLDAKGINPQPDTYRSLLGHLGLVDDEFVDLMMSEYIDGLQQFVKYLPGAEELLLYLRQKGLMTGIITNGHTENQMRKIYALKLDLLVDSILVSEKEDLRKPDPEIFWRAASRLNIKPSECLFIGDNPEADILGAHGAGMTTIWTPTGIEWPDGAPENPGFVAENLPRVLKMLVKIGV